MKITREEDFITTEIIEKVLTQLEALDDPFELHITSGLRDEYKQLELIGRYAKNHGIIFPEFSISNPSKKIWVKEFNKELYSWQRTWSKLLNIGIIINPPLDAICLYDYISDGVNKKGQIIKQTPHARGKCFDVSGKPDIDKVQSHIEKAQARGVDIKDWRIERKQNVIHVDCL